MQVLDRLGRPITETMGVAFSYQDLFGSIPVIALVAEMVPIMDPHDPNNGGVTLKLVVQLDVPLSPLTPIARVLIVQGAQAEVSRLTQ